MNERQARELVKERAKDRCEICGGPGYEFSHRRTRAVRDEHTWCPCNGVWSCRSCHVALHRAPRRARELGQHVTRYEPFPGSVPVRLGGAWWMLRCEGTWEARKDREISAYEGAPIDVKEFS